MQNDSDEIEAPYLNETSLFTYDEFLAAFSMVMLEIEAHDLARAMKQRLAPQTSNRPTVNPAADSPIITAGGKFVRRGWRNFRNGDAVVASAEEATVLTEFTLNLLSLVSERASEIVRLLWDETVEVARERVQQFRSYLEDLIANDRGFTQPE